MKSEELIVPCKNCILLPKCVSSLLANPDIMIFKHYYEKEMYHVIKSKNVFVDLETNLMLIAFSSRPHHNSSMKFNTHTINFDCEILLSDLHPYTTSKNLSLSKSTLEFYLKLFVGEKVTVDNSEGQSWLMNLSK